METSFFVNFKETNKKASITRKKNKFVFTNKEWIVTDKMAISSKEQKFEKLNRAQNFRKCARDRMKKTYYNCYPGLTQMISESEI